MTARLERPHVPLAALGLVFVSLTSVVGSGFSPLAIPFVLWSAVPYAALWIAGHVIRSPPSILGAGTAALAAELGVRAAVFLWPRGSTAAVALVFSPVYIAVVVMPVGAAVGWAFGRCGDGISQRASSSRSPAPSCSACSPSAWRGPSSFPPTF